MFDSGSILAKNKLKILYIFYTINIPINNTDITKFVLEKDYMDYFTLQKILTELKEDGFLTIDKVDSKDLFYLTEAGKKP